MSVPNYTYFVTINEVITEVHPYGDWSLKIAKAEEDFSFCKDYRIKFGGEFIFSGDDYDLFSTECCNKIELNIKCDGEDYWFGYFAYPYGLSFDEDRCEVKGTPKPLDKYYYFDLYADQDVQLVSNNDLTYLTSFPTTNNYEADCIPCEPIWDIIEFIGTNPPLFPATFVGAARSTFLQNDLFPDGTNPYPVNNYATGEANLLHNVVMAMAEDVCTPGDTNEWEKMSWNDLMELLHNSLNTWWFIDENGHVRIEHIYFWELYGTIYDLTTVDAGRWIVNSNKYTFQNEEMPKKEMWGWNVFSTGETWNNFIPEEITYYDCFLPGKSLYTKEYPLTDLNTDFEYIAPGTNNLLTSPTCANVNGYMLLRCLTAAEADVFGYAVIPACAEYIVWFSQYLGDGNDHLNAHLSPINLITNYWMHDRPYWEGTMVELDEDVIFESIWRNLLQRQISFPVCCDEEAEIILEGNIDNNPRYLYQFGINFNKNIITQYGAGELYTGTIKDGMVGVELLFEYDCGEDTATDWDDYSVS